MKNLRFQNGDTMPSIGLGTWLAEPNEVYESVLEALRIGYRHIDCAHIYKNEIEVGHALDYAFRYGIVKREEIFVTSKLWNSDHNPESVEAAINKSLSKLQLKKLDLYLIHWPVALKEGLDFPESADDLISLGEIPLAETWKAMAVLKSKDLTKHIGVSNFNTSKIESLITDTKIKPEVNQVELHPYFQQKALVEYCQKNGIIVTAYSPFGGKRMLKKNINIFEDAVLVEIAEKHKATTAQIVLAWGLKRGTSVIPKTVKQERLTENLGALNIKLSAEDMSKIEALDRNLRFTDGAMWTISGSPYTQKSLWEE